MMHLTIRRRLLLLTLLPPLLLLMVILAYFIYQDSKLLRGAMLERGDTVSRYLASAAEYGVITGNLDQLHHISDSVIQGDIVALRVYDFDNKELFTQGEGAVTRSGDRSPTTTGPCGGNKQQQLFCAPIVLASVPVSDYENDSLALQTTTIGRIELTLTTRFIAQKRTIMLRWSLLLVLTVIVLAVLLSRRMERQLVEPLSNLSRIVEQVRHGALDVKVTESASGELLALQQGVNAMVDSLANARQHLEKEVEDATGALRNTLQELEQKNYELQVEQQRAEIASLAKSQFLATMSHEIRTPLSGMIGMLQLLRDSSESPRQLDYVDSLENAAQSLRQLIDDILDFSRLEVGKLAIQNQPFSPRNVIEEVMMMLTPSAHHKGLELVLDSDGMPAAPVVGDPLRFRQVLINLTANAIKFTDQGEVVVTVRSVTQPSGKSVTRFDVCDSGIGIAKDKQALVFESFTQVDEGDARSYGGSGLGTTVSRELVEMMGGQIGLESEPGKGSCFWFELPWEFAGESPLPERMARGRALVLERHPAAAAAIQSMLQAEGVESRVVTSEQELDAALLAQGYEWLFICEDGGQSDNHLLLERLATGLVDSCQLCKVDHITAERSENSRLKHLHKPLLPSALQQLLRDSPAAPDSEATEPVLHPLNVLLAEDEAINARVILHYLQQGGHQVVRVMDGEEALQQLRVNGFDCVLMDLRMPRLDGLEATRRWRSEETEGRLPIIALTANASEEDRDRCTAAGMDDYLTKPVDSKVLLDTLARYCAIAR